MLFTGTWTGVKLAISGTVKRTKYVIKEKTWITGNDVNRKAGVEESGERFPCRQDSDDMDSGDEFEYEEEVLNEDGEEGSEELMYYGVCKRKDGHFLCRECEKPFRSVGEVLIHSEKCKVRNNSCLFVARATICAKDFTNYREVLVRVSLVHMKATENEVLRNMPVTQDVKSSITCPPFLGCSASVQYSTGKQLSRRLQKKI